MTTELGIREVAERTGLTIDTLRWYGKEGLIPFVARTAAGQRRYPPAAVRFIRLVQALRRTGTPVADVREFGQLGGGALDVHPVRLGLLERQTEAIEQRPAELTEDLAVVRAEAADHRRLTALGLDCEDEVADGTALSV